MTEPIPAPSSPASPAARLIAALSADGIDAYDGEPDDTPAGRYLAVWDDTGLARPARYAATTPRNRITFTIMCVARTPDGLRDLVADTRAALTGLRLGDRDTAQLVEQYAGPSLSGGPTGDIRRTKTLTYAATFPTRRSTHG